jgi:hypothetical protein
MRLARAVSPSHHTNRRDAARRRLEDPTTWALVERVAEALAIRRLLDADEFRGLVTR